MLAMCKYIYFMWVAILWKDNLITEYLNHAFIRFSLKMVGYFPCENQ